MKRKVLYLTQTSLMLALLVALQWLTKPWGQLVTGTCVNAVLAITCLLIDRRSGMTVGLVSPVFAFVLGIAPNVVTVPAIIIGNLIYVQLMYDAGEQGTFVKKGIHLVLAALAKFITLYLLVVVMICGSLADVLLAAGTLKEPMLKALPATFSWPQLVTALAGGAVALLIAPILKKALKKND